MVQPIQGNFKKQRIESGINYNPFSPIQPNFPVASNFNNINLSPKISSNFISNSNLSPNVNKHIPNKKIHPYSIPSPKFVQNPLEAVYTENRLQSMSHIKQMKPKYKNFIIPVLPGAFNKFN